MNLGFMGAGRRAGPRLGRAWVGCSRRWVAPCRPIGAQGCDLPFLPAEAAPVAEEHDGGETVGGDHEAPVVGHHARASASRGEHAGAPRDEVGAQQRERREVDEQRGQDARRHRAGPGLQQRRRLVQRAPPVDREVDERDVERGDDAQHRGVAGAPLRVFHRLPEQEIGEEHDEHHRHARQSRVPRPPGAPGRLAPDGAGGDVDAEKDGADLAGGVGQPVGGRRAGARGRRSTRRSPR